MRAAERCVLSRSASEQFCGFPLVSEQLAPSWPQKREVAKEELGT